MSDRHADLGFRCRGLPALAAARIRVRRGSCFARLSRAAVAAAGVLASLEPAAAQRVKAGALELRRLGRLRLDHRLATVGDLHVRARRAGPTEAYTGRSSRSSASISASPTGGQHGLGRVRRRRWGGGRARWPATMAARPARPRSAVGLGANVLVGGSNRTVALQPLSVQGQIGLNLAAGVADLRAAPAAPLSAVPISISCNVQTAARRGGRFAWCHQDCAIDRLRLETMR